MAIGGPARCLFGYARDYFSAGVTFVLVTQIGGSALAFSPRDYPSFTLKIFGYDAVIFYRPRIGQGGLSTSISIDQRHGLTVAPATAEEIQRQADKAQEIELVYDPESAGSSKVDLLSTFPSARPFSVNVDIYLQRSPFVGQIGNPQLLSAVEKLSDDPDRSHFDEYGYRILDQPVVNFVMQRKLYSRPDRSPLFFSKE